MSNKTNNGSNEEMLYNIIKEMESIATDHIDDDLWLNPYLIKEIASVAIVAYKERKDN